MGTTISWALNFAVLSYLRNPRKLEMQRKIIIYSQHIRHNWGAWLLQRWIQYCIVVLYINLTVIVNTMVECSHSIIVRTALMRRSSCVRVCAARWNIIVKVIEFTGSMSNIRNGIYVWIWIWLLRQIFLRHIK
jgi:hypothetical protein